MCFTAHRCLVNMALHAFCTYYYLIYIFMQLVLAAMSKPTYVMPSASPWRLLQTCLKIIRTLCPLAHAKGCHAWNFTGSFPC
ncbi:hypothetical protein FKM82_007234 [Ascaphus truei]